jgi:hypothetical protein
MMASCRKTKAFSDFRVIINKVIAMTAWSPKSFQRELGDILCDNLSIDTRNIAERAAEPPPSPPAPAAEGSPKSSKSSALVERMDRVETSWVAQLSTVRSNLDTLEAEMHACLQSLRHDMAKLDQIGEAAMKEAERSRKISQQFATALDQIKSGR